MSYSITCYFNDDGIEKTVFTADAGGVYNTYDNSDANGYDDNGYPMFYLDGFAGSTKFIATPAVGASFSKWVYRLDSVTGTRYESTDNPFVYTEGRDIFIRAESIKSGYEDNFEIVTIEKNKCLLRIHNPSPGQTIRVIIHKEPHPGYTEHDYETVASYVYYTKAFDGLSPGTEYAVQVCIDGVWGSIQYFTTDSEPSDTPTYTFSAYSNGTTSIITRLEGFSGNEGQITINYYLYTAVLDLLDTETKTVTPTANESVFMEFNGLEPGSRYIIQAVIATLSFDEYADAVTDNESVVTEPWSWRSTIASGAPINITASEWTGFCTYINGVRSAKGVTPASYNFTPVTAGVTKISAAIVNQARSAIDDITGHGTLPDAVSPGDPITASFFIDLAKAINVFASQE